MAGPVHVLDDYYLSITWLVTMGYQLLFFAIAFSLKFDKLTDFAGGTNFILLAVLTLSLSGGRDTARNIVASLAIAAWAARLSGFLFFRILKTGKDDRFDDKRDKFLPFLGFWVAQMLWVWIVSLPVTVLNSPRVTAYGQPAFGTGPDIAGIILFALGLLVEAVSDAQKFRFRSTHGSGAAVCDVGFFAWSRHPNYFGEMLVQFGIYSIAVAPAAAGYTHGGGRAALYASVIGPVFLTVLLMFVSGLTLQERPGAKKRYEKGGETWLAYRRYLDRTSILIPFPPQLYVRLPTMLKRTLFLEFPIYVFDPTKHADGKPLQQAAGESEGLGEAEHA